MSCLSITELTDIDVIITETVEFDISNKDKYIDLFEENINKGIIKKGTKFHDDNWIINIGGEEYKIIFQNDFEISKLSKILGVSHFEFQLAYKSFLLFNLHRAKSLIPFNLEIKKIAYNKQSQIDSRSVSFVKSFFEYIKVAEENSDNLKKIISDLDNIEYKESGNATLPNFEDVFLFSDIINDIIENKGLLHYKDYLLVIMWWKICSVLPLRPSEFIRTKYNCIYQEEEKFYLEVRRSKGKKGLHISNISNVDDYYENDTVRIDYSLFNLIETYKKILKIEFSYDEDTELFPYVIIETSKRKKSASHKRTLNKNRTTATDLSKAINSFYNKVIKDDYVFDPIPKYIKKDPNIDNNIDIIAPNDARHIAIINLVLMGCDVLDVMNLAGHNDINTAYSYFNHVKEFSKGYALGYMKSVENKERFKNRDINVKENDDRINKKDRIEDFNYVMNIIDNKEFKPQKVDGGYCCYSSIETDKSVCYLYEGNHALCKYFKADNKDVLKNKLEEVEKELDVNIKLITDIIADMNGLPKFYELYQTTSFQLGKNIKDIVHLNIEILKGENK